MQPRMCEFVVVVAWRGREGFGERGVEDYGAVENVGRRLRMRTRTCERGRLGLRVTWRLVASARSGRTTVRRPIANDPVAVISGGGGRKVARARLSLDNSARSRPRPRTRTARSEERTPVVTLSTGERGGGAQPEALVVFALGEGTEACARETVRGRVCARDRL